MSVDLTVPGWVSSYADMWITRLSLEGWQLTFCLDRVVNDNPACMGLCERKANYNAAVITLRADIEDTQEWRKVLLHELLHVAAARVDNYVENAIIPDMYETGQTIARRGYTQHMESHIQNLTDTFYWVTRYRDFPDEYPQDAPPKPERRKKA
jgi:hypothetical protein